jgi:hypothetical protein
MTDHSDIHDDETPSQPTVRSAWDVVAKELSKAIRYTVGATAVISTGVVCVDPTPGVDHTPLLTIGFSIAAVFFVWNSHFSHARSKKILENITYRDSEGYIGMSFARTAWNTVGADVTRMKWATYAVGFMAAGMELNGMDHPIRTLLAGVGGILSAREWVQSGSATIRALRRIPAPNP